MTTYRLEHIADLAQIAPEHWDECMRDLRGMVLSLHLLRDAAIAMGEKPIDFREALTHVELTPDGKGTITPMLNGEPLFEMTVTRDDA